MALNCSGLALQILFGSTRVLRGQNEKQKEIPPPFFLDKFHFEHLLRLLQCATHLHNCTSLLLTSLLAPPKKMWS